jgi:hypothetical protein
VSLYQSFSRLRAAGRRRSIAGFHFIGPGWVELHTNLRRIRPIRFSSGSIIASSLSSAAVRSPAPLKDVIHPLLPIRRQA